MITEFKHQTTIPLYHQGDCSILGLSLDGILYLEEFYDEYIAQHQIHQNQVILSIDEDAGTRDIVPFKLPDNLIIPDRPTKHALNYQGLRLRGLREEDHIQEWILPLELMQKMPLLSALAWPLPSMLLLGIAESRVLAQVQIDDTWLICRRLQLAYALERRLDSAGLPYDYDSRVLYLLQLYSDDKPILLQDGLSFAGIPLQRPMDLIYHKETLILAEGGTEASHSRVVLWEKTK